MTSLLKSAWIWMVAALVIALSACSGSGTPPDDFASERERFSYAHGMEIGRHLFGADEVLDMAIVVQGIEDVFQERQLRIDEVEAPALREQLMRIVVERRQILNQQKGERNRLEGEAFLAGNAQASGVTVTSSGLQYRVIRAGNGPTPKLRDQVKVHYEGSLLDGTVFDSSIKRGEPAQFALNRVIQGWAEALQLMPVGSKYQLFIPAHLAYRDQGTDRIGPQSTLIFEVELLEILD